MLRNPQGDDDLIGAGRPDWIDHKAYPFDAHWFHVPQGRMHYVDEGSGRPVVMVHGNPTWSFLYRHLIKALRADFRCVVPDHIGFGLSDKPPDWSHHPQEHAKNLAALIETLRLSNVTLVVQDWGGPVGLSYAVDHPENTSGLVILNTWMWPVDRDPYYLAFSTMMGGPLGRFLTRRFNLFARVVMRRAYGDARRLTPEIHDQYLTPLSTPRERRGSALLPRHIVGASAWLGELWERREALRDKPVLIAWGMKDIAFREKELETWIGELALAQVLRLEHAGHYVQEEAPAELAAAVGDFLSSLKSEKLLRPHPLS